MAKYEKQSPPIAMWTALSACLWLKHGRIPCSEAAKGELNTRVGPAGDGSGLHLLAWRAGSSYQILVTADLPVGHLNTSF